MNIGRNNVLAVVFAFAAIAVIFMLGREAGKRIKEKEAVQIGAGEYYTIYTTNSEEAFRWKVNK